MRLAAAHGDWIEFREDLSRVELNRLMGRSRYGIQAMENEHFGMATAEMTRAGCLVFAHDSGGSPEVLNDESATAVDVRGRCGSKDRQRLKQTRAASRAAESTRDGSSRPRSFVRRLRDIVGALQVSWRKPGSLISS